MLFRRTLTLVALTVLAVGGAAACSNDDEPDASPTGGSETPSTTSPSTSEPTPSAPTGWESNYTEEELDAFEAAMRRLADYEREAEPIWRRGKYTPDAEQLFREYFTNAPRQTTLLRQFEAGRVQIKGVSTVLWSKANRIRLGPDGASVTATQCIDENTSRLFQNGKRVKEAIAPQLRDVALDAIRRDDGQLRWYIRAIVNAGGKRPCPTEAEDS